MNAAEAVGHMVNSAVEEGLLLPDGWAVSGVFGPWLRICILIHVTRSVSGTGPKTVAAKCRSERTDAVSGNSYLGQQCRRSHALYTNHCRTLQAEL